jgi:hypothetical protein
LFVGGWLPSAIAERKPPPAYWRNGWLLVAMGAAVYLCLPDSISRASAEPHRSTSRDRSGSSSAKSRDRSSRGVVSADAQSDVRQRADRHRWPGDRVRVDASRDLRAVMFGGLNAVVILLEEPHLRRERGAI